MKLSSGKWNYKNLFLADIQTLGIFCRRVKYKIKNANTNTLLFAVYEYTDLQAAVTSLQFRTESRLCLPVYAHVSHDFTPHPGETRESLSGKIGETIDRKKMSITTNPNVHRFINKKISEYVMYIVYTSRTSYMYIYM